MTAYYGGRYESYGSSYNPRYEPYGIEYPGYDNSWNVMRDYSDGFYRSPIYSSQQKYSRSRSVDYPHAHYNHSADLAWETEIPTRLRVRICCEGCRMKMDKALRDIQGVHDVGIEGWENAMVTVTGIAPTRKILKEARKILSNSELWSDSHYGDQYANYSSYNRHH